MASGFLVSPELLLTAAHVLPDVDVARAAVAEFNFEVQLDGTLVMSSQFALNPDRLFVTNEALDYSLVATSSDGNDAPGYTYGWCSLGSRIGKVVVGEKVQIVGHPLGEPKTVSSGHEVRYILDDKFLQHAWGIHHLGSSGAPVFNVQWELVAMHHASFPDPSASGADHELFLGEAVLVSAIFESLKAVGTDGSGGGLLPVVLGGGTE